MHRVLPDVAVLDHPVSPLVVRTYLVLLALSFVTKGTLQRTIEENILGTSAVSRPTIPVTYLMSTIDCIAAHHGPVNLTSFSNLAVASIYRMLSRDTGTTVPPGYNSRGNSVSALRPIPSTRWTSFSPADGKQPLGRTMAFRLFALTAHTSYSVSVYRPEAVHRVSHFTEDPWVLIGPETVQYHNAVFATSCTFDTTFNSSVHVSVQTVAVTLGGDTAH